MWRAYMAVPGVTTYTGLVQASFAQAPKWQRNFMIRITCLSQYAFIFSMLGLYALSFGKGLGMTNYSTRLCLPIWSLIGCLAILPFNLTARRLGAWQSLIYLNVGTILGTIIIPLVYMASEGVEATRPPGSEFYAVTQPDAAAVLSGLSTFTFAFTSQFMLVEIMSEMRDPAELPKAYALISGPFQCLGFLLVGLGGYYYVGSAITGIITDNIPFGTTYRAASACLLIHMLIVYLIKSIVLCNAMHGLWDPNNVNENNGKAWITWAVLVTSTLVLAYIFSQVVPFFSDFVDLLGASLTPISCFIIPVLCYIRSYVDSGKAKKAGGNASESESETESSSSAAHEVFCPAACAAPVCVLEWIAIALELGLGFTLTIFGTYSAANNIMKSWDTYGLPFECHCESTWNTCECSAEHVGMEFCSASANGTA